MATLMATTVEKTNTKENRFTFILDVAQWRCGQNGLHAKGIGETLLRNDFGYMCCVGQFLCQLGDGSKAFENMRQGTVDQIIDGECEINLANAAVELEEIIDHYDINKLYNINDNKALTTKDRIKQIRAILRRNKCNLVVLDSGWSHKDI